MERPQLTAINNFDAYIEIAIKLNSRCTFEKALKQEKKLTKYILHLETEITRKDAIISEATTILKNIPNPVDLEDLEELAELKKEGFQEVKNG